MMLAHGVIESCALWWGGMATLGFAVGVVCGMFGVGGGFLITPLLTMVFGVPMDVAVGTGLCQMIGTGVSAYRRHRSLGHGETKVDMVMLAGGLIGAPAGARVVAILTHTRAVVLWGHPVAAARLILSLCYVLLLGGVAAWMLYDAHTRPAGAPVKAGPLTRLTFGPSTLLPKCGRRVSVLILAYIGLILGFLSGLLGIGGGVALVPILIYGVGMSVRMAAGTGIILLLATSSVGTVAHAMLGHVNLAYAIALMFGSTLGAPIGATITHSMDGRKLRGVFAYLVLLTAAAVLWNLVRI